MTGNEMEILCIGNALVDVFAQGDASLAARYGISRPVQHIEIEKLQTFLSALSECDTACPPVITSGGGAANLAKIAALLGVKVGFTGALGSDAENRPDEFGRLFKKNLKDAGVKLYLPLKSSPTGICLMLRTENNETRIAASPSAAIELSESDIGEEVIRNAKTVVIDGFMLNRNGLVRHILRLTGKYGVTAALDLSSPVIAAEHAAEIADYARQYPLILFMNEAEAVAFYKAIAFHEAGNEEEIHSFFRSFTKEKSPAVIVEKLGERGALVFAEGTIHRAETPAAIPRETTGAGDAFAAAFLTAWVRNKSLPECAVMGNKTARIVLDVTGTRVDGKALENITRLIRA